MWFSGGWFVWLVVVGEGLGCWIVAVVVRVSGIGLVVLAPEIVNALPYATIFVRRWNG